MAKNTRFFDLLEQIKDTFERKNLAYGKDNDTFSNFRKAELFGVSPFIGCLIRMSDKFSRIESLSRNPEKDKVGESILDSLLDLSVYSLIAVCLYEEENNKPKENQTENYGETKTISNWQERFPDERLIAREPDIEGFYWVTDGFYCLRAYYDKLYGWGIYEGSNCDILCKQPQIRAYMKIEEPEGYEKFQSL